MSAPRSARVVALCGGVGGAKLALGLYRVLGPDALTVIVNTGDDFEHLGLHVSPDLDTVLYTLAGRADRERGWGRADESWNFMSALAELGEEDWFRLGTAHAQSDQAGSDSATATLRSTCSARGGCGKASRCRASWRRRRGVSASAPSSYP